MMVHNSQLIKKIVCVLLSVFVLIPCFSFLAVGEGASIDEQKKQFNANLFNRVNATYDGNYMYYTKIVGYAGPDDWDGYQINDLIQRDLSTNAEKTVIKDTSINNFIVHKGYIYYFCQPDTKIYRCKIGEDRTEVLYDGFYEMNFVICGDRLVISPSGQDSIEEVLIMNLDGSGIIRTGLYSYGSIYSVGSKVYLIATTMTGAEADVCFELNVDTGEAKEKMYIDPYDSRYIGASNGCIYVESVSYDDSGCVLYKYDLKSGASQKIYETQSYIEKAVCINDVLLFSKNNAVYYVENGKETKLCDYEDSFAFIADDLYVRDNNENWNRACALPKALRSSQSSQGGTSQTSPEASLKAEDNVKYLLFSEMAYKNWSGAISGTGVADYVSSKGLYKNDFYKNNAVNLPILQLITDNFADWQFESVFENTASGFYAVAFKNSVSGEKVLAFRGSQSIGSAEGNKDWTDDIVFGIFNEASAQMADALAATEKFVYQNGGDKSNITLTGHSLGGGLAVFASNMYNIKAVTFDSAPTSSVGYYYFPAIAALSFKGVDATMYEEHINEHDPVGLLEFSRRNGVKHKNMIDVDKVTDIFAPHGRNTIVTEENGSVVLSSTVDVNKVKPYTEAVGRHNEILAISAALTAGSIPALPFSSLPFLVGLSGIGAYELFPKGSLSLGSSGKDKLFGNSGDISGFPSGINVIIPHTDVIYGGDGNDKLYGMLGNDYFIGGNGNDEMNSDGGNDTYFYYKGQGADTIYDGSGNDKIYLLGFDKNEKITVDSTSDEKWIFIKYGGETIIRIRNYQDQFFGNSLTHSFEVFTENSKDGIKIMDWGKATSVKKIKIACPVSVTVLDAGGNELVTLNDYEMDTVDLDEGFFSVEKDSETGEYIKILNLFDDSGCSIRINGLDSGSMDVQVSYTSENGNVVYSGSEIPVQYNGLHTLEVAERVMLTDSNGSEISLEKQVYVPVQTVTAEKVTVKTGKTKNAVYEVDPIDATCGEISFISGNPQIATVDENGVITGVSPGTAQMTVQVDDKLVVFDVEVTEGGFNILIIICIIIAGLAVTVSSVSFIIYKLNNKKNK